MRVDDGGMGWMEGGGGEVVMVVIRKRMKQIASQSNTAQHDEDELQVPSLSTEDWLAVARLGMCCN